MLAQSPQHRKPLLARCSRYALSVKVIERCPYSAHRRQRKGLARLSERSMSAPHIVLNILTASVSIAAAACWVKSASVKVLSPNTQGWGALVGGYVIVRGPRDRESILWRV